MDFNNFPSQFDYVFVEQIPLDKLLEQLKCQKGQYERQQNFIVSPHVYNIPKNVWFGGKFVNLLFEIFVHGKQSDVNEFWTMVLIKDGSS